MTQNEHWQRMHKQHRLRHQLELQSMQIEKVLTHHRVSAQVAGGRVQPRSISFDLQSQWETGLERLRGLKQDLLAVLGVADVNIVREDGRWRLDVQRPEDPPVSLLDLLPALPPLPPKTAVLGLAEDGSPLLLELSESDMPHVLISGDAGAGKTALLRTMALSLALNNRQSQLQLAIIAGEQAAARQALAPLTYLPHMLAPVTEDGDEACQLLAFLTGELDYRLEQSLQTPAIVVLVDNLVSLIERAGTQAGEAIARLLQHGAACGIHLIAGTKRPDSSCLDVVQRANLPVRVVGQTASEAVAASAAGIGGTQANYLLGAGDFLAVVDTQVTHFQAAYIGSYDLHLSLDTLHRSRPRPLLAQPLAQRSETASDLDAAGAEQGFTWLKGAAEEVEP